MFVGGKMLNIPVDKREAHISLNNRIGLFPLNVF